MENQKRKMNFLSKTFIYLIILVILLVVATLFTKYYLYDSTWKVKQTDLSQVEIDGIKLGSIASDIDTSKYEYTQDKVDNCNYNYKEISYKTNSKGDIVYIIADYKKVGVNFTSDQQEKPSKITDVWNMLGENYTKSTYKPEENNYWRICKYVDTEHGIYIGIVYSRYNNDISKIIMSKEKIK